MSPALLEVENLCVQFRTEEGLVRAVDQVCLRIQAGETLALVGESGCGKTVTSLAIMGLVPQPPGEITSGQIRFEGRELLRDRRNMRRVRGRQIAMIFQDPMSALNPFLTIGQQLTEPMRYHLGFSSSQARRRAVELLEQVGVPDPRRRLSYYPHQLSGGQRQRVMIAMALSCQPKLLIADEPTTALDVTVQAQILALLAQLQQKRGLAILLITHDLGVVATLAHRVAVMYAGRMVEQAPVERIFRTPLHPYTHALLGAVPRVDGVPAGRLATIGGEPPHLAQLPPGCAFHPRCPWAQESCRRQRPELEWVQADHARACPVDWRRQLTSAPHNPEPNR